jgi:adenylate kinase
MQNKHLLSALNPAVSRDSHFYIELGMPGSCKTSTGRVVHELIATLNPERRNVGIVYLESSKLITSEIAAGTDLGRQLEELSFKMKTGALVDDSPVMEVFAKNVLEHHGRGVKEFIADGCVRTINQGASVVNAQLKWNLIHFETTRENSMDRIRRRALKEGRHDDAKPETVQKRLAEYEAQTNPVLAYFAGISNRRIHTINASLDFRKRVKLYLEYMGFSQEVIKVMLVNLHKAGHPANTMMLKALEEGPQPTHLDTTHDGQMMLEMHGMHNQPTHQPTEAASFRA